MANKEVALGGGPDLVSVQAKVAKLVITLVYAGGKDPAQVYGSLTATVGWSSDQTELFQNSEANSIPVGFGRPIPLKVSEVKNVPLYSDLKISANLVEHDPSGTDEEIANGNATFHAKPFGSEIKKIGGANGQIQVKVMWE